MYVQREREREIERECERERERERDRKRDRQTDRQTEDIFCDTANVWALLCLCRCVTEHLLLDSRRKEAEEAPAAVHVASLCLARQSAELRGPVGGAGVVAAGNTTVGSEASVDSSLQGQLTQMPASLTSARASRLRFCSLRRPKA